MGSEISSLVVSPIFGLAIVVMCVFAIIKQTNGDVTSAQWLAIGAIIAAVSLIVLNLFLSLTG